MVRMFTLSGDASVLDPCFGKGVFIHSLLENTSFQIEGVEIDELSYSHFTHPLSSRCHLYCGDFFDVESTYDGIIMNPPYVRQEEIDGLRRLGVTKQKLQSACGLMSISTKANLYMYFILRAVLLLRDGGELIAIFPNSWTNTPVGRQFREQMTHFGFISDFITVVGEAFEGSPMVDVCIMKYVKSGRGETSYKQMHILDDSIRVEEMANPKSKGSKGLVRLRSLANIRRGITTGFNKLFINPPLFTQDHLVDILSSPKDVDGFSTRHCLVEKLLALQPDSMLSEEEHAYIDNCAAIIKREGRPETLKAMIDKKLKWYVIQVPETAHILFAYIVRSNMKFILNDGNRNVRDNFYMISSKEDPLLLLALLNNFHVYCQLECCGKTYGKGLLKLQKYDIDNIELPRLSDLTGLDKQHLKELGGQIAKGDVSAIDEATTLLNIYFGTKLSKEHYYEMKQKRLLGNEA